MLQDNWVTVEQAPLEAVAEMMRGRLEAEGIEAVLRGNRVAGAAGIVNEFNISWQNPLGGVEVRVRPDDVERAREILAVDERSSEERVQNELRSLSWVQLCGMAVAVAVILYVFAGVTTGDQITAALIAAVGFALALALMGLSTRNRRS